jgi:hypothetical protein
MSIARSRALTLAALSALIAPAAFAADDNASQDARVRELEAKVAALETKQASNSKDVAATIDSVLRDAERRSQLLQNSANMGAGFDNGFYIAAGDAWTFRPGVNFQFWNVTNYRDDSEGDDDDEEMENGFEVHRLELMIGGTAFTKDLTYFFMWDTGNEGGSLTLLDAFVNYMFADAWGFRAGQFNDPVHHENLMDDWKLLAAERSLVDALLGGGVVDRTQGVALVYGNYAADNPVNAIVMFHDGFNQDNTNFQKQGPTGSDFGVAGRLEWKAMGTWDSYADFTAMGNKEDLLALGIAGDWTQFGDTDVFHGTADLQWENAAGLGAYIAGLVQHFDNSDGGTPGVDDDDATNWGVLVQANYLFNPAWELFGRVSYIDIDDDIDAGDDELSEWTLGLNYYLGNNGSAGHRAKVTIDLTYLPDGTPDITYRGFIGSDDDEWVLRGQFQLWI